MTQVESASTIIETEITLIDNKKLTIKCPPEEVAALQDSAKLVRNTAEKIKATRNIIGIEKVAQMTALNIAYELLKTQNINQKNSEELNEFINKIIQKTQFNKNS